MDTLYAIPAVGLAAVMIFFVATIVAGIIVGTSLALADLVTWVRGARQAATAPADQAPADSVA